MKARQRFVIFSGANERAIVACCRHFERSAIPFSIISRMHGDKICFTAYKKNIDATRKLDSLDVEDMLEQLDNLRQKYPADKFIYLPTAESINRVILKYRDKFASSGLVVTLCDEGLYTTLSDKSTFNALAQAHGIVLPQSIPFPSEQSLPFVAKPEQEFSKADGQKIYPQLIFTEEQRATFLKTYTSEDFFYQKYIDGESYYLLLFMSGDVVKRLWQKNILQQADGKSIIAAEVCPCPDVDFESSMIALLQSVNYAGFIMVEIMRENGMSCLIEANPRLWGPFELAIRHGFNPEWVQLSGAYPEAPYKPSSYLWLNGWLMNAVGKKPIRQFLPAGKSGIGYILRSLSGEIYARRDTLPLLVHECRTAMKKLFQK